MMVPLVLDGEAKEGKTEGDVTFELKDSPTTMAILSAVRYAVMLALYGGFTAVIVSVCVIEGKDGAAPPPVSPAMQCVMNLTVQFFFVYLMLWAFVTTKQFTSPSGMDGFLNIAISTMDSARATVHWAANKRLETSKFKFKFPRARNLEVIGLVLGGGGGRPFLAVSKQARKQARSSSPSQ